MRMGGGKGGGGKGIKLKMGKGDQTENRSTMLTHLKRGKRQRGEEMAAGGGGSGTAAAKTAEGRGCGMHVGMIPQYASQTAAIPAIYPPPTPILAKPASAYCSAYCSAYRSTVCGGVYERRRPFVVEFLAWRAKPWWSLLSSTSMPGKMGAGTMSRPVVVVTSA